MIQNFDTLTEYIQGPCYGNQQALLQGNFLDLATNLLLVDEIMEEIDKNIVLQEKKKEKKDNSNEIIFEEGIKK